MVNASKGVSLPRHRAHGLLRFCDNFQHSMVLRPFKTLPLAGVKATSFQNKNQRQKGLVSASKDVCASASKAFARESQTSGSSSANQEALEHGDVCRTSKSFDHRSSLLPNGPNASQNG